MSLVEHIQELRQRLLVSLAALAVGAIVGFLWYQHGIPHILPPLGELLRRPYCALPPEDRVDLTGDGRCRLLATGPFEMFALRLKIGAMAGVVLSSPVWLGQLWGFITPGLHKNERKWTFWFVSVAVTLFVLGALLAYFVMAYGLEFLLTVGDQTQVTALNGDRYFSFFTLLLLLFGVSFEVPLILVMLNFAGIVSYDSLKDKRRIMIVVLFIFAAFMTPGQDPFSMAVLGTILVVLNEVALQITHIHDKRHPADSSAYGDLDDEQASTLDYRPEPISPAAPAAPAQAPRSTTSAASTASATARPQSGVPRPTGELPQRPSDEGGYNQGTDFGDVL